jgi:hypothetical protein
MGQSDIYESAVNALGDHAGIFEYDGKTGYFYLYEIVTANHQRITAAIQVLTGIADFKKEHVAIRWTNGETMVGLFIRGELVAAFDSRTSAKYGGDFQAGSQIAANILAAFQLEG